uniref:ABC transporter family G domain-containing protein n=1 Tax=Arundo donax TaxID=35708 RepID=A0A0A9D236_ARUDO
MLVTPGRALFMDEISTGLDSSTTFQIVNSIGQTIHIVGGTAVIALLQPAPETYELFDDIILLSDGQVVYNGPREHVLEFFESVGFKCPQRKGVADFLQEVSFVIFITVLYQAFSNSVFYEKEKILKYIRKYICTFDLLFFNTKIRSCPICSRERICRGIQIFPRRGGYKK